MCRQADLEHLVACPAVGLKESHSRTPCMKQGTVAGAGLVKKSPIKT